jgi:hypothetical protein
VEAAVDGFPDFGLTFGNPDFESDAVTSQVSVTALD